MRRSVLRIRTAIKTRKGVSACSTHAIYCVAGAGASTGRECYVVSSIFPSATCAFGITKLSQAARTVALAIVFTAAARIAEAQVDSGRVVVQVSAGGVAVARAVVSTRNRSATTDASGTTALTLPIGPQTIHITRPGFAPESLAVIVSATPARVSVELNEAPVELETVVVASTRTERRVADEPTRVEIVDREDVEEQIGGSPGIIAELLTESGGIRVQRASAGSGGSAVRVRGMRGRYTKILSDGLPLFGVTTDGLGPLQIPPIDLARVEVIKGISSALYGPTALGGVVNLVSERPTSQPEFVLNQLNLVGSDAVLWQTHTLDHHWGYTVVAGAHRQVIRDVDGDQWADFNGFDRIVVRPRLFWTGSGGSSWFLTTGLTSEKQRRWNDPGRSAAERSALS